MNYGVGNPKGEKGADGVSPIVSVEAITGGYEITITDANGTQTFTVMNGQNGTNGTNGQDGITPSISVNANVNNSVGTPSVSVVKSGTNANPVFTFNFQNLKGETGTTTIKTQIVNSLPSTGDTDTIYFVANNSGESENLYNEYLYVNNAWERVDSKIDLSNYIQKSNTSGLVKNDGTIDTTTYLSNNSNLLLSKIVDSQGHNRFIEGDLDTYTIANATFSYAKWSLSGTHLMIVLAGDTTQQVNAGTYLAEFEPPTWLYNKIYPLISGRYLVSMAKIIGKDDYAFTETRCYLDKYQETKLLLYLNENLTVTSGYTKGFRVQFDLLIDTD